MEFSRIAKDEKKEEREGLSGDVKRSNQLGTVHGSWGPLFRISLDLIIRSKPQGQGWYSLLAFKETNHNWGNHGDRIPALFLYQGTLFLFSSVSGNPNYHLKSRVPLNKWFNLVVEQNSWKGKVRGENLLKYVI